MSNPDAKTFNEEVSSALRRAEFLANAYQWVQADSCYQSAVELDRTPRSLIEFATSLATRERYNEAICHFTTALDLASQTGDRQALGIIYHNLAAVYRELEDFTLARRFQQRALQQMDECGPAELLGLANDAWLSRRPELAACLASSCNDTGNFEDEDIESEATLSVISGLLENPDPGVRSLIRVYRRHRASGAERLMGIDLMNLSILLGRKGWPKAEISAVRRAIRHFHVAQSPVSASRAARILSTLERLQALREFDPMVN